MNRKAVFDGIHSDELSALIDGLIRNPIRREMLRDWLINDMSFSELEDKYGYSLRHTKRIIYTESEKLFKNALTNGNKSV